MAEETSITGLASHGLQGRILEVAVIVGMNEETGLQLRKQNKSNLELERPSLFQSHFQGHLLDILSGPQDGDTDTPLKDRGRSSWRDPIKRFSLKKDIRSSKPKKVQRVISVRKMRMKANNHEKVPVSTDFLSNLPCICLPEDSRVYETQPNSRFHSTVLTDMEGVHHYAAVLTFYQQYFAIQSETNSWKLVCKSGGSESNKNGSACTELCYVPCCACLVSAKPYFEVLKDFLSCLHKDLSMSSVHDFRRVLEKFVTNISLVVCPPPCIKVCFSLGTLPIIVPPPDDPRKQDQIVDIDLRLPLFIMKDPTVLLRVIACIMLEQRVVFFSEDYSLLPLIMECFLCYIRPMEWHHQYIPILFSEIIGFVDCPGIFMMGCHSKHKMEIEKVENDLFLVDLDNARIYSNSTSSSNTGDGLSGQFALHMPGFAVDNLLRRLSEIQLHNSVTNLSMVNPVSLKEIRENNIEKRTSLNMKIQMVFMDFMIDLFGTSLHYMDHERCEFKRTEFLESIQPTDSPFYIKAVKTYMFRRFMKQRLKQIPDQFSTLVEEKTLRRNALRIQQKRGLTKMQSMDVIKEYNLPSATISRKSVTIEHSHAGPGRKGSYLQAVNEDVEENFHMVSDYFADSPNDDSSEIMRRISGSSDISGSIDNGVMTETSNPTVCFNLPTFPVQGTNFNAKHFYRRCVEAINNLIEKVNLGQKSDGQHQHQHPDHSSIRAGLLYLRGCYRLAEESLVQGWDDLHATAKEDARFFPEIIIQRIAQSLNFNEREHLQQHSMYKVPIIQGNSYLRSRFTTKSQLSNYFNDDDSALSSLKKEPFTYILEKNDVTTDHKIISLLYQALSENSSTDEVDAENFNAFYQTWKQLKHECETAKHSFSLGIRLSQDGGTGKMGDEGADNTLTFHSQEKVLKVSGTVSSSKGNGRLVLTSRRLLFIAPGNEHCKSAIDLQEILYVNIGKLKNFMSSTTAVIIMHQHDSTSPLKVGLKSDCELWSNLINEMKTGKNLSRDQRDHMVTLITATQNVLIADAFYTSVTDEGMLRPQDAMIWVKKLCNFEKMTKSGEIKSFSTETEEMLVMCMDPCPKQSKKAGIQAILYSAAAIDEIPRVWVILGSGQIRLIDTTQWNIDPKPIGDWKSKPTCMCLVKGRELWVGADDGTINIFLAGTMKIARILHDHSSYVIAIIGTNSNTVVSASRSGDIIIWSMDPVKIQQRFSVFEGSHNLVALTPFKTNFCCCSTTSLVICDMQGNTLQRLTLGQFSSIAVNSNLTCCAWEKDDELWAGDSKGAVYVWDCSSSLVSSVRRSHSNEKKDINLQPKFSGILGDLNSDIGITCMIKHEGKVWLGKSNGEIVIINSSNACQERMLNAHSGPVTVLCKLENRYMVSGSGGEDGKVIVWRQRYSTDGND